MTLENRHAREAHNFYPEPPSASDALFRSGLIPKCCLIYDPASGCGSVGRMADRNGHRVAIDDLRHPGGTDFLTVTREEYLRRVVRPEPFDIVTNPPYGKHESGRRIEELFIEHALGLGAVEVWALLPLPWMAARIPWLHETGLCGVYVLRPRLSILSYSAMKAGEWPGGGGKDYAWYRFKPTLTEHCRKVVIFDELHRNTELDTRENWTWWDD